MSKNIILGITGSIAAYKACDIARSLQKKDCVVDIVMTKESQAFITPLTLQSLVNGSVYWQMFDARERTEVEHVSLAKKARVVLIAPATAQVIGKLATGIYDDLLTCIVAATGASVCIAPAMNERMYKNPVVQDNIARLKKIGMHVIDPQEGTLACGQVGQGCLASVDTIVEKALALLK